MSLDKTEQVCKKCNKVKNNVEEFSFIKNGQKRRKVCRECNYGNRFHFYESASKKEILEKLKQRLDEKVEKTDGCWGWKGFIRPDGYTRMKFMNRYTNIGGHVVSWMVHNKEIEVPELNVLHICDNRNCCNPGHLFLGTYRENSIDMVLKKRHPGIKLTIVQVRRIKEKINKGVVVSQLAKDFSVSWATINDIKTGKTWRYSGIRRKLTVAQVEIIKERLDIGVPVARLAKDFNVDWSTINNIKTRKTWKHV